MSVFRKLALGGGGVKGILHIGALQELSKYQPLEFPEGIYGSSIGSVIATYIAFGLPFERSLELTQKYLGMSKILPDASIQEVSKVFSNKGIFSMNIFEQAIVNMFAEVGLDIRSKVIGDAKMPLFIVASNITRGIPTIFTKQVPVLDALKCSCCLPGLFHPQELYGQLYLDGGLFTPCIATHAPDALCILLKNPIRVRLTPKNIKFISPTTYLRSIYDMSNRNNTSENIVSLMYPKLYTESNLENFDVNDIMNHAQTLMRDFLRSKGRC